MRVFVNELINDRRRTIFRGAVTPGMYRVVGNGILKERCYMNCGVIIILFGLMSVTAARRDVGIASEGSG